MRSVSSKRRALPRAGGWTRQRQRGSRGSGGRRRSSASKPRSDRAMARVVGIDHLVIRVSDFERSKSFYDTVLGFLGFKRKYTSGKTAGWSNGKTLFWIGEADAEGKRRPHRIGDIGFHHYAFELSSRRDVDALYAHLEKHDVKVVD